MGNSQKQPWLIDRLRMCQQIIGDAQGLRSDHTGITTGQYILGLPQQQLLKSLGQPGLGLQGQLMTGKLIEGFA